MLTAYHRMNFASYGNDNDDNSDELEKGSSQRSWRSGGRITGMRLWTSATGASTCHLNLRYKVLGGIDQCVGIHEQANVT